MISFPDALKTLLANVPQLASERVRIEHAAGRVLRQEVYADRDFPPFDRVMMDGYALRCADLQTSREFTVVASGPAGAPQTELSETTGACIEIMTGAPLPFGADCIVPIEETDRVGDQVCIADDFEAVARQFVHSAGSDARQGAVLLESGAVLGSSEIGIAASCGAAELEVSKLPRISVVATGDELVAVDESPAPHQIRQSNAHAISAALTQSGYPVQTSTCLRDDREASAKILRELMDGSDWVVLTGAVSKGAHDYIPTLLDELGCERLFHSVAQRPGKPAGCWIGPRKQMIMALPGNPVSAITGLHAFVLPGLATACGARFAKPRLHASPSPSESLPHMTRHLPVTLTPDGKAVAAATGNSGDFIGLLLSDGFLTLPPSSQPGEPHPFTPWT